MNRFFSTRIERLARTVVLCAFLPILLAATSTSALAQTVIEEIVARVNDQIITRTDLQRSREQLEGELKQQSGAEAPAKFADREKDILRDLIDQQLLLQRGKDAGINAEADVIKRLDEIRKSMNLDSMEDLDKAAQAQGISYEDFKNNLRTNIITQQVIGQEVGRKVQILPSEVTEYYNAHKQEMQKPEQVHLAEILVSTEAKGADGKPVPEQPGEHEARTTAAEGKAKQLLESIRKGAKFEDVAKQSSDGPTAAQGGDLGFFKRGSLAKSLEDTTFAMKSGEVSDVINTKQGFVILKVMEHDNPGVPPQKEVENQIYETLYYQRLQPTLRTYLTKLREDAYIDVKPGFIDSGASPNQTKPIVTNVASAEGKPARKRKKKLGVF